jgi:hypothetical protein
VTDEDEERISGVQDIQSFKLRCIAVNPSSPAVAQIPRPRTPPTMARASRSSLSTSAAWSPRMVPRRFIRRRDDCNSSYQTLYSENASLECTLHHHHSLCIVIHFSSTFSTIISILLLFLCISSFS